MYLPVKKVNEYDQEISQTANKLIAQWGRVTQQSRDTSKKDKKRVHQSLLENAFKESELIFCVALNDNFQAI